MGALSTDLIVDVFREFGSLCWGDFYCEIIYIYDMSQRYSNLIQTNRKLQQETSEAGNFQFITDVKRLGRRDIIIYLSLGDDIIIEIRNQVQMIYSLRIYDES